MQMVLILSESSQDNQQRSSETQLPFYRKFNSIH